jgi:hypothetical protein
VNDYQMRRRLGRKVDSKGAGAASTPVPVPRGSLIGRTARERDLLGRLQARGLELGELRELIDIREAGRS